MSKHTKHSAKNCEVCAAQQEADAVAAIPTAGHTLDPQPQQHDTPERIWISTESCEMGCTGDQWATEPLHENDIEYVRADLPRAPAVDDKAIQQALRPIRGCATDDQYVDVFERVSALVASAPRATAEAGLTVESALAELRETFPHTWFEVVTGASFDGWYYKIRLYGMPRLPAMKLDEAMDQVRAWSKSRAATSEEEGCFWNSK